MLMKNDSDRHDIKTYLTINAETIKSVLNGKKQVSLLLGYEIPSESREEKKNKKGEGVRGERCIIFFGKFLTKHIENIGGSREKPSCVL